MKAFLTFILTICLCYLNAQIAFTENASASGINHQYELHTGGGGISFVDFNNDGLDDLTMATGKDETIHFYQNTGSGFQKLIPLVDHTGRAKQVSWIDIDNDGDKDFFIATYDGSDKLYENVGGLELIDISFQSGMWLDPQRSFGATWADFNRDGFLDVLVATRMINGQANVNRLYRNNGNNTFTEVSQQTDARDPGRTPFCSAFFDANRDNWPDIYIANDKNSRNTLLINDGDGTYTDMSDISGCGIEMDAMCVAVADYDNNGWSDFYVSNTSAGNKFFINNYDQGNAQFDETAEAAGIGFFGTGWGSNFLDADNNGLLDLYVSGSQIGFDKPTSLFYENLGNDSFAIVKEGFEKDTVYSVNNAVGDINNDGYPDIAVINLAPSKSHLYINNGGDRNWLKISLEGVISNREGVGSWIDVYYGAHYQSRYTHSGIAFMAQNSEREIIGVDSFSVIDSITIKWSTGHTDQYYNLQSNETYHFLEGASTNGQIDVDPDFELLLTKTKEQRVFNLFEVYPNPATQIIHIRFEGLFETLEIFNVVGKSILRDSFLATQNMNIPIAHLNTGVYFLQIRNSEGVFRTVKFIKE